MKMLKADLHVHTKYSMDCDTPLEKIIQRCQQTGINCVAIADHGTVEGALKLQKMAPPFKVIVAEEILTPQGEIMGIFLKETIPSGLSAAAAIARIREQGGLVSLPHPFDTFRQSALATRMDNMINQVDIIEVFNARTLLKRYSDRAQEFARKYGLAGSAGSDAHTPSEIGHAYIEIAEFSNNEEFIQALKNGRIIGRKTSPLVHFNSTWTRIKKRL